MWMSNDCVSLKNFESPYGGGVSSLLSAAGDPPPVMFPVAPVLLAGGPQLGPWQVAVVRVDETPAGDSSKQYYPCATPNRHWPMGIYELHDSLAHTVVEGGPAGPEFREPLALLVLDHADPVGQHAVIQNATRSSEHPLAQPETSLGGGLVERHVGFRTLPWTVDLRRGILTWSIRLQGFPWTVDPWRGCRVWSHWSSRFFDHHGLHDLCGDIVVTPPDLFTVRHPGCWSGNVSLKSLFGTDSLNICCNRSGISGISGVGIGCSVSQISGISGVGFGRSALDSVCRITSINSC